MTVRDPVVRTGKEPRPLGHRQVSADCGEGGGEFVDEIGHRDRFAVGEALEDGA
jgi:hypothetical protein